MKIIFIVNVTLTFIPPPKMCTLCCLFLLPVLCKGLSTFSLEHAKSGSLYNLICAILSRWMGFCNTYLNNFCWRDNDLTVTPIATLSDRAPRSLFGLLPSLLEKVQDLTWVRQDKSYWQKATELGGRGVKWTGNNLSALFEGSAGVQRVASQTCMSGA